MTSRTMKKHMMAALDIKAQIKALEEELDKHTDAIKKGMTESGMDTFESDGHKVTYKNVVQSRFDSSAFKKVYPALYDEYKKESASMRFTLA